MSRTSHNLTKSHVSSPILNLIHALMFPIQLMIGSRFASLTNFRTAQSTFSMDLNSKVQRVVLQTLSAPSIFHHRILIQLASQVFYEFHSYHKPIPCMHACLTPKKHHELSSRATEPLKRLFH